MNWAFLARRLYEDTMGRLLPTDLEDLTLDQALILTLPKGYLSKMVSLTPEELASSGLIPPHKIHAKSKCQQMQEAAAERRAAEQAKIEAARRERRRQRRRR